MAARPQLRPLEIVDLRHPDAPSLTPLLAEERERWLGLLHWDYGPAAALVERYAALHVLDGLALVDHGELVGYAYWVAEDHKGLIGDLFVRDAWRSPENENRLLAAVLDQLRHSPWLHRVEAQIMQLGVRGPQVVAEGRPPRIYPRHFMRAPLTSPASWRPLALTPALRLERWTARWLDSAADLIATVYRGHVDSEINDQYESARGARRFLQNIVQYPGCGFFSPAASWVAIDSAQQVCGIALSSLVAPGVGHLAQICVEPRRQGAGLGYELMRRALASLSEQGIDEVSLTVTAANHQAVALYNRFGFRVVHQFEALVWGASGL